MYTIHTNVGTNRKPLVTTLTNLFGYKPEYAGAPTFAYDFGTCKVDRYGTLILPRSLNAQGADRLASVLDDHGFECSIEHIEGDEDNEGNENNTESSEIEQPDMTAADLNAESFAYTVRIPTNTLTGCAFDRFVRLVDSKHQLICKALGADDLPIEVDGTDYLLPWFDSDATDEERAAYDMFVQKLIELSNHLKRVVATEKDIVNEKYQFRCFLLRLGFIGDEYKEMRKVLTRNLTGNSAFHCGFNPKTKIKEEKVVALPENANPALLPMVIPAPMLPMVIAESLLPMVV